MINENAISARLKKLHFPLKNHGIRILCLKEFEVRTCPICFTVIMPVCTLPNIVCLLSNH